MTGSGASWGGTPKGPSRRILLVTGAFGGGVGFGPHPQRVIAVLIETAASVSGVLGKPAPVAFFQGFGDSALNFELRAWTDRFEEWVSIRSQMAVAVNSRLKAEGIEIPLPQRDVNLHYAPREET